MLLELRNIKKTYRAAKGDVSAVNGVSLSVDRGQFVGVQGPSGCGKTTLLLIAGGLLTPDDGDVAIGGQDPFGLPADQRANYRANNIGFVFQQFHLVPYLNVIENVLAASIAAPHAQAEKRARELIAHVGLESRIHHVPAQLSTGERQRTAFARALLNQPKLLLADEPTGNLDHDNAQAVLGYLKEFSREGAVLMVTHDARAVDYADTVAQIREGQLLQEGVSADTLTSSS